MKEEKNTSLNGEGNDSPELAVKKNNSVAKTWSIPPTKDLKLDQLLPPNCLKLCVLKFCFLSIKTQLRWGFTLLLQNS